MNTPISLTEKHSAAGVMFKKALEPMLLDADEPLSLHQVSNLIQQDHPAGLSLKRLGIELGFPKSWTARKMIEHAFGDSVTFTGSGPATYIQSAGGSEEQSLGHEGVNAVLLRLLARDHLGHHPAKRLAARLPTNQSGPTRQLLHPVGVRQFRTSMAHISSM